MSPTESNSVKNFGLFGHGGAGKTTLAEAMLYAAGTINRMGDVEQGNTTTDFEDDEISRSISINCSLATLTWGEVEVTLLDTPGYADFVGDALSATRVVDTCGFVLSGVDGVEVQTEIMWEKATELGCPSFIFINKLDRDRAGFERVLEDAKDTFGNNVVALNIPVGEEHDFRGVIDLLSGKAFELEKPGKPKEVPVPDSLRDAVSSGRDRLIEAVVEADDSLLEKYLEDTPLSDEDISSALRKGFLERTVFPVLCGSAAMGTGICELLDFISKVLPLPCELPDIVGTAPGEEEEISIPRSPEAPLSALVFKTLADPYVGKLTYFRVFSGILASDSTVLNSTAGKTERVGQLFRVTGKEQSPVSEFGPGGLGAVSKLGGTSTGDTLCDKKNPLVLPTIVYPAPLMSLAVEPKTKGDEDKLSTALARLSEEDPMLEVRRDTEVKQTLISGAGENHLDVVVTKMRNKFGVDVSTESPTIPYKETIRRSVEAQGKHKKQTGGHGQFGHCFLRLEPLQRGEGFQFEDKIVGGAIPRQYIPGVEKGVIASMQEGFLAGYPIVDIKVTVYDGSFHSVDSSEMAFKMAASKAVKAAMDKADPVILEPIADAQVTVPDQFMGDVIGDLNSKRGRIIGMTPKGKMQVVQAQVPMSEMSRYSIDLRSITGGRGVFTLVFSHYEEVPEHIASRIIAGSSRREEED